MTAPTKLFQPNYGLVIGSNTFGCDASVVFEVVQVTSVESFPMAPDYVCGVVIHNGEAYTVIRPEVLFSAGNGTVQVDASVGTTVTGLLIRAKGYHNLMLAGQSVTSLSNENSTDWRIIELPAVFKQDPAAEPLEIGCRTSAGL